MISTADTPTRVGYDQLMNAEQKGAHGGSSAPPIAGDANSFPSDAELARTLAATTSRATLCTLTADGYPFGSVVSHAVAKRDGAPILLISELAEHTVNVHSDERVSLLVTATTSDDAAPLSIARLTLIGTLGVIDDPSEAKDTYLSTHPYAQHYAEFSDFSFWRLTVEHCRFVGGFGHMSWVDAAAYATAQVDPVADSAAEIITHMNEDHADANLLYVQRLAGLTMATSATMTSVDGYGVTLQATTPDGPRLARVAFPSPLRGADETRGATIELLLRARAERAGGRQ